MTKRPVYMALILWFGAAGFAHSQTSDGFAPFVSELRAESRNNLIRLSWLDSRDARGPVYVFRSARPFNGVVPQNVKPVALAYGTQVFIDETDGLETIYYFIAASDSGGRRFDIFIPQTNTVTVGGPVQSAPVESSGENRAGISLINARADGEGVVITYRTDGGGRRNAVLYRSAQAIRQPQDLIKASVVQSGISSPFTDYPVPGTPWYYAVIFEDEITGGGMEIRAGRNATLNPVEIAGGVSTAGRLRAMPLPSMTVRSAAPESDLFQGVPRLVPLRAQTLKTLEGVQAPSAAAPQLKQPRVFARDMEAPAGGEDSGLMRIVQSSFVKRDWENAHTDLLHFLSLPHSADTESRARFYLGQTWYFTGKYREALLEFLFVQSRHPAEANSWIDAVLAAMVR